MVTDDFNAEEDRKRELAMEAYEGYIDSFQEGFIQSAGKDELLAFIKNLGAYDFFMGWRDYSHPEIVQEELAEYVALFWRNEFCSEYASEFADYRSDV